MVNYKGRNERRIHLVDVKIGLVPASSHLNWMECRKVLLTKCQYGFTF